MGIAGDLIYIVLAALVGGILARLIRQPLILGYVIAGVFVGPYTGGITIKSVHDIEMLAEIGVALLLFTLGLEFSLSELKRMWKVTLLGTPLQMLLAGASGMLVALAIGLEVREAIWFGAVISLSSTMVVLKSLQARGTLNSLAGKLMLAILIAQDLALIPMMLVLPQLTGDVSNIAQVLGAIGKSFAFLIVMYFGGTQLFPRLFSYMARWGSRELFFLCTLAVALGIGYLTYLLGLSFAFGAFIAGILLSETDFNHQALSDVSGLRDLFGLLFFVSVGMLFDPVFFVDEFLSVFVVVLTLISCKVLTIALVVHVFGYRGELPWIIGCGLSQIGEFAFLLASTGVKAGALSSNTYSLIISAAVFSMVLTPALMAIGPILYRRLCKFGLLRDVSSLEEIGVVDKDGHVIIVGGGTVGEYLANTLRSLKVPLVFIELDLSAVKYLRTRGYEVIFGDGSHPAILKAAGIQTAKLLIVASTDQAMLPRVIQEVKELAPNLAVVARVEEIEDVKLVADMGVREVVQPKLEAGLELVRQSLLAIGSSDQEIFGLLSQLRAKSYRTVDGLPVLTSDNIRSLELTRVLELSWFRIKEHMSIRGRSLLELKLRERFGVSVVAIVRGQELISNLGPDITIKDGDKVGVLGSRANLGVFAAAISGDN